MNTILSNTTLTMNMSHIERVLRITFGSALLVFVATAVPGVLGWASVLALIATYPILTGITGADPLRSVMEGHRSAYRVAQLGLGIALIGTVAIVPGVNLGLMALLPLFGIYSVLGAILGRSPLATVVDANQTIPYVVPPANEQRDPAHSIQSAWHHAA